jgi:hypothetical protein
MMHGTMNVTLSVLCKVVTKFLHISQALYTLRALKHYVWYVSRLDETCS